MRLLLLLVGFFTLTNTIAAKLEPSSGNTTASVSNATLTRSNYQLPTAKLFREQTGRKLSLKEKISRLMLRKYVAALPGDVEAKNANTNAIMGLAFSVAALFAFPLLAIPELILSNKALKADKLEPGILTKGNHGVAKAGQIISYVVLGLLTLGLIIVAAYFLLLFNR